MLKHAARPAFLTRNTFMKKRAWNTAGSYPRSLVADSRFAAQSKHTVPVLVERWSCDDKKRRNTHPIRCAMAAAQVDRGLGDPNGYIVGALSNFMPERNQWMFPSVLFSYK